MWTRQLFASTLLTLLTLPTLSAGVLPFKCHGYSVKEFERSNEVGACLDTLTIHVGVPIPEKHPDSPVEWPVQIFKRVYIDDSTSIDDSLHIIPVELTVRFDKENGDMIVVTEGMPAFEVDSTASLRYMLYTDCRYFDGPTGREPVLQYFTKQSLIRGYALSRSIKDSSVISERMETEPSAEDGLSTLLNGLIISTLPEDSIWSFDHWTSSVPIASMDPYLIWQVVKDDCWPLFDTVVFTAWYKEAIVHVDESVGSTRGDRQTVFSIRYESSNAQIIIENNLHEMCTAVLIDVQGRAIRSYDTGRSSLHHTISTLGLYGPHFLVGTIGNRPIVRSFVFHK